MKFTKIALAVAALAAAQNASAATDIYMSGASALRDFIPQMMNKVCQPNSGTTPRTMYIAGTQIGDSGKADKDRVAFTCTLHTTTTSPVVAADLQPAIRGQVINLYWSNEIGDTKVNGVAQPTNGALDKLLGGSITGVATVAPSLTSTQATVNFVKLSTCTTASTNTANAAFAGSSIFECSDQTSGIKTQIGISDIEPSKFDSSYFNTPSNVGADTTIPGQWINYDVTALSGATPMFAQGFAVVVQNAVMDTYGVTNLSLDQLAGILSGNITDWRQVGSTSTTPQPIKVCTRAPGSGTKGTFNQIALRAGCSYDNQGNGVFGIPPASATNLTSGKVRYSDFANGGGLREGATTGQVIGTAIGGSGSNKTNLDPTQPGCMNDGKDASGLNTAATGTLAIGIVGLDALDTVDTTFGIKAIGVNGVNIHNIAGTQASPNSGSQGTRILESNIVNGGYPLWVESTAQLSAVSGAIPSADSAVVNAFYSYVSAHAGDIEYTTSFPGIMTLDDTRNGTLAIGTAHTTTRGDMYFTRNGDTCSAPAYQ